MGKVCNIIILVVTTMQTDVYVNHQLNTSITKATHSFSKAARFPKRHKSYPLPLPSTSDFMYDLPSTKAQRSTSFGVGQKCPFPAKVMQLPPGTYQLSSDFERKEYKNVTSMAPGREKVTFGSFLLEALKQNKNSPSPDRYNPVISNHQTGGGMGYRIKTDPGLR